MIQWAPVLLTASVMKFEPGGNNKRQPTHSAFNAVEVAEITTGKVRLLNEIAGR